MTPEEIKADMQSRRAILQQMAEEIALIPIAAENKDLILSRIANYDTLMAETEAIHNANLPLLQTDHYCYSKARTDAKVEFARDRVKLV